MRIAFLLATALLARVSATHAAEPVLTGTTRLWAFRLLPNGKVPYRGAVVSNDFVCRWPGGAYVGAELWLGLEKPSMHSAGNEADLTIGWKGSVGRFTVDASLLYGDINPVGRISKGDFISPGIEVGYPITHGRHVTTPFVKGDLGYVTDAPQRDGSQFRVGVADKWKMGKNHTVNQKAFIMHTSPGVYGLSEGNIFQWWGEYKKEDEDWRIFLKYSNPFDVAPGGIKRGAEFNVGVGFDW